jgi:hypothetical protein
MVRMPTQRQRLTRVAKFLIVGLRQRRNKRRTRLDFILVKMLLSYCSTSDTFITSLKLSFFNHFYFIYKTFSRHYICIVEVHTKFVDYFDFFTLWTSIFFLHHIHTPCIQVVGYSWTTFLFSRRNDPRKKKISDNHGLMKKTGARKKERESVFVCVCVCVYVCFYVCVCVCLCVRVWVRARRLRVYRSRSVSAALMIR